MISDWFEVDEELHPAHTAVVDLVRAAARTWPECPPGATAVLVFDPEEDEEGTDGGAGGALGPDARDTPPPADAYDAAWDEAFAAGQPVLMLIVDLRHRDRNLVVMTLGATVAGNRLFCGEHNRSNYRPELLTDIAPLEATGSPEELGAAAAAWFGEIVRRPMIEVDRVPWPRSFVPEGTTLPPGHVWVRNP